MRTSLLKIFFLQLWASILCAAQPLIEGLATKAGIIKWLDFTDMSEPTGDNMGGFTVTAYIAETKDIATEPVKSDAPATLAESVTLTGPITMEAGKYFHTVYITPRTFSMLMESQGEIDGKSFRPNGEFFYPSSRDVARGFAKKIKDAKIVLIAIDPNTGERIWIGSKNLPVFCSPRVEFGAAAPDRRGVFTAFECDSPAPGYDYNGAIPLDGSTVPAIS